MVGTGANNTDADTVALIPASETVNHVDAVASVEVVDGALAVDSPDLDEALATHDIMARDLWRQKCGEPERWPRQAGEGGTQPETEIE
jgi:hypothetical protein